MGEALVSREISLAVSSEMFYCMSCFISLKRYLSKARFVSLKVGARG